MKNKFKKSNSPNPRTKRSRNRWINAIYLTGFALGLAVVLALFSLLVIGLPPQVTQKITNQLKQQGIPLKIESIRLSLHHGWVLKNTQVYSTSPDDLLPLLHAKKLYVMLWPVDWQNPTKSGWHVTLRVKNLDISLGRPWETVITDTHPFRTISRLEANVLATPEQVTLEEAKLVWGNLNILIHGTTLFKKSSVAPSQPGEDLRRRAAQAVDAISQLKCTPSPQLNIDFNYNNTRPEETTLNLSFASQNIIWKDRVFESLSGSLRYRDSTWLLSPLQLSRTEKERLTLYGALYLNNEIAQLSVENSLSVSDLFSLLPEQSQSAIAQTGIKPYGPFNFTASAGPVHYLQLTEHFDITIHQAQFKHSDLTIDPISLQLTRNGPILNAHHIQAQVNEEALAASVLFDLNTQAWSATAQTQCDPSIIGNLMGGELKNFISRFKFPPKSFQADLILSQAGPGSSFVVNGTLSGDQFTCVGIPVHHFKTFMSMSNHVLDLAPLHIIQEKKQLDGSVRIDFNRNLAFFDVTNSFPPIEIARALAPNTHTILEDIRIEGPVYAIGKGQLDYGAWTNHAFQGTFHAENIGFRALETTRFQADVEGRGTQLLFNNLSAPFYGGTIEGSAAFDLFTQDGSAPYQINAHITHLKLEEMLQKLSTRPVGRTHGKCSATINLTADAKAGFWQSVNGTGNARIDEGYLAEAPFLNGFSRLIQSSIPRFKLFSLTTFSADYALHDATLWSDNAKLGGTIVSANGRGSYSPNTGLNFSITAEPFRQIDPGSKEWYELQLWAADALKAGTAPFLSFLNFQLTGPLDKPEWSFRNSSKSKNSKN